MKSTDREILPGQKGTNRMMPDSPQSTDAGTGADGGTAAAAPNLTFGGDGTIIPDKAIIHDNETFAVQWIAKNLGPGDAPAFTDLLVVTKIPEGCPGSDDQDHPIVYNSGTDGNPQDYMEQALAAGASGPVMQPTVGPFATGSYRLTVTLAQGVANVTNFNCIDIIDHTD
jgi:hypothetical protein